MKIIERIVESTGEPNKNDLWLDTKSDKPSLKMYAGGEWVNAAGQEPIIVAPKCADSIVNDAAAMGVLVGHINRGTIFDVLVEKYFEQDDTTSRIINANIGAGQSAIRAWSDAEGGFVQLAFNYTQTQYEGIAAVQQATGYRELADFNHTVDGTVGFLCFDDAYLVCVGDNRLEVTTNASSVLTSIKISSIKYDDDPTYDKVEISWEDAQKLIGVKCI